MEWLYGVPATVITNGSAVGVLAVAVLGILRGWLVPGRLLDQMLELHRQRLIEEKARGDEWREAARVASERADERDQQVDQLLAVISSTATVLDALHHVAEKGAP